MATTALTVLTQMQARLRIGAAEVAVSDANIYSILNSVQRAVNYGLQRVVTTGTFKCASSITTINKSTVTVAANCVYVLAMYETTRSLMQKQSWTDFQQYSFSWQTSGAARSEAWGMVGDSYVVVYPASTITYNCVYLQETTTLNSSGDTFNLPDEDVHLVRELAEIIWLAHLGHIPEVLTKIEHFREEWQIHRRYQDVSLRYRRVSV